jgi:hypothetical protein
MAINNTINLLPQAFRSATNQRFLGATMDQLTTDAYNTPVNGYIGRKFSPTYKSGDNYVGEISNNRSNYQLEPSVVIKDANGNVVLNSTYLDLLNSIATNGGFTNNHQRLFTSQYYNYDGHFDYDKFVNYNNYYWIPGGPDYVNVSSSNTPYLANFSVTRNTNVGGYTFSGQGGHKNTQLTLARGGTYTFVIDQPGFNFWIQSEPGVNGVDSNVPSISTRQIFGVTNNGTDNGVIQFNVPLSTAQNFYTSLPTIATVTVAVTFNYTDINNVLLSQFFANFPSGLDGINNNLQGKTLIFINSQNSNTINQTVWQINLVPTGSDYTIQLLPVATVTPLSKVFIGSGKTYVSTEFWMDKNYVFSAVPPITATNDYLYYQDSSNPDFFGQIQIVDNATVPINIASDIIGKKSYTAPNGVVFTNGLKVLFDELVVPSSYAGNQYYVEGVGTSIQLVPVAQLAVPEQFGDSITTTADYITINRASQDQNPWSRSNCWFHVDVLNAVATYNKTTVNYGPNIPGRRAIIEFEPNLQLFNFGKQAKANVDLLTFDSTDAFVHIEGQTTYTLDGVVLTQGMRVIFANDYDPNVKQEIWQVDYELINGSNFLRLIETIDDPISAYQNVLVIRGANAGTTWYYDGTNWHECQAKTSLNQPPLFDVVDANGYSFSDTTIYPSTTFAGTKFFGYAIGTGANDSLLGFPLSYQNFNNVGDIVFTNYYDNPQYNQFTYSNNFTEQSVSINSGYLLKNDGLTNTTQLNNWIVGAEDTEQYQIFTKFYDGFVIEITDISGNTKNYPFVQIDILSNTATTIPYVKVFLNNKLLDPLTDYNYPVAYGVYSLITINPSVVVNTGDKIDVAIFSSKTSATGYYEIPENLDYNSLNQDFNSITLGQLRNHYNKLIENTSVNDIPLQDSYLKAQGGTLLQHSSPLIYGMTFLTDPTVNFVNSIDLSRKEYSRFKNKFLNLCASLNGLTYKDPITDVDTILSNINSVKNSSFAWYYSDMVPQGSSFSTIKYTVLNARQTNYEISSIFDTTKLSNRAVLVYHNGVQLTLGKDYTFSSIVPSVTINITLTVGDVILIRDYSNTDGNYIPETPSKLGLYPKFEPTIFVDNSYITPTTMIRGHDGSFTPAFGDFRDQYLLELELRIYNNIKANYATNALNVYETVPGRFRTTDYRLAEWNQVITKNFLQWVGINNIDYTTNSWFDANNPWTWNYDQFPDAISGNFLQGSWRAIYNFWYDTDTPHLTPWKMLGLNSQPSWWATRYGPAPYTSGNSVLWADLEKGYIWNNGDSYTNNLFARPGLTGKIFYTVIAGNFQVGVTYTIANLGTTDFTLIGAKQNVVGTKFVATGVGSGSGSASTTYTANGVVPVDSAGNLLTPQQTGILSQVNSANAGNRFLVGEQGPVETAWRRSSDFPYAIQNALAFTRPAEYFATQIDTSRFYINSITGQFSNTQNQKISPSLLTVNGDTTTSPGTTFRTSGYLNWIADNIKNLGIDPVAYIENYFQYFNVQLAYKVAGFTDQNLITVSAEQTSPGSTNASVIIPNENYLVYLGKPIPITSISYSAVIVTKTDSGYTVSGYDTSNPFFYIYPGVANSIETYPVTVNNLTVKINQQSNNNVVVVPYGTLFTTIQQVADFLMGYQRFLQSNGFIFEEFDTDLQMTRDWVLSTREFLFWVQQNWASGTIIVLNPTVDKVTVRVIGAVVDEITNNPNGSRILNPNFDPIKSNKFNVVRMDYPLAPEFNQFLVSTVDGVSTIGFCKLNLIQYENTLIFDNTDNFGDIIYVPEQGTRQYRLKINGSKTGGWDGAMSPTGYIYSNPTIQNWQPGVDYRQGDIVVYNNTYYTATANVILASQNFALTNWTQINSSDIQTGLLPSFGHNAQKFINFYDVDRPPVEENLQLFSGGLIGFRERPFLSNLGISIPTQTKFYQGYIKQKGTINSINALTSATFDNVEGNVSVYEEWAFQVGRYGDINSSTYSEFILDQSVFLTNPVAFTLTANTFSTSNIIIDLGLGNIYNASNLSSTSTSIYNNRNYNSYYQTDLPSTGYVNLNDIDLQVFDITKNPQLPVLHIGNKIWTAKNSKGNWDVFRITEVPGVNPISLRYTLDSYAQLTFNNPHNLSIGDYFILGNFNSSYDGFYQVLTVVDTFNITIQLSAENVVKLIKTSSKFSGEGTIYKLVSSILNSITQVDNLRPPNNWINNDRLWINNATPNGWGVYTYSNPWLSNAAVKVTANTITANNQFGSATAISTDEKFFYIGNPGNNSVQVFANIGYNYSANVTISNAASGFGSSVDTQHDIVVVGAPTAGNVYIYKHGGGVYTPIQVLTGTGSNQFGTSVTLSKDAHWLYVGEPGDSNVYAYWTANTTANVNYTFVTGIASTSGSNFGAVVKTNATGNVLYVGAPGATNVNIGNGNVYVYAESANSFSLSQTLSSQYKNTNANFGSSIAVDGTGTNLFIGIPNSIVSGYQNGLVEHYTYSSGSYIFNSNVSHPNNSVGLFGSTLSITNDSSLLAIGSTDSATEESTTFDNNTLVIDDNFTKFIEYVKGTGAIYMYQQIIDQSTNNYVYSYTQELSKVLKANDNFGSAVTLTNDIILVGAKGTNNSSGVAYIYSNPSTTQYWSLTREISPKVDITSINRTFIYNKTNNVILTALDFIDPLKGKVLNAVGVDIDYQLTTDPALYNVGDDAITDLYWGPSQVGKIWWDLNAVRYIDYEQDDLSYRLNNWGKQFSGSQILIYEWVESPVLPSQYVKAVGDGIPLHSDDSAYSTYAYVTQSGLINLKYYFWVSNKTTINTFAKKSNSVYSITTAINNPQSQGISYATVLRDDTIAMYNVNNLLTGKNSVLHLGNKSINAGLIHSEYQLVQEGNSFSQIPSAIKNKLIDSLAGQDKVGNVVPDPSLTPAQAYGVHIRPRQTMFVDRLLGLSNYITFVNDILIQYPIVENKIMTTLNSSEAAPNASSGAYNLVVDTYTELGYIDTTLIMDGYAVLVNNDVNNLGKWAIYVWHVSSSLWVAYEVQSYKTNLYWTYADWYQIGYDHTVAPNITVANNYEYGQLKLTANTYIKVLNNGNNQFVIYYIDNDLNQNLYGIQNGTVQFSTGIIPPTETRQLALAIQNDIFVNDLAKYYNELFFTMVKYILTEQKNLDWVFKTSFLSATQYIRALAQFPAYVADNQQYYLDYISEVKPFRTSIRQFVVDYQGNDTYGSDVSDFDIQPYWDANLKIYRSPDGSQTYDSNLLSSSGSVYSQWYSNYKYQVVDIVIENSGSGYGNTTLPQIIISGGGGTGANAYATLNNAGGIANITVTNAGEGYTTQPTVIINGVGSGASAYAVLENVYDGNNSGHNLIRSLQTTIKFDRVNYTSANTFVFWNEITSANFGQTISANTIIVNNSQLYVLGNTFTIANVNFPGSFANVTSISYGQLDNANDRIIASNGNIDLSLTQSGLSYPGVIVDGATYHSFVTPPPSWTSNTVYSIGATLSYQGNIYQTTGNAYGSTFGNIVGNVTAITAYQYQTTIESYYGNVFGVNPSDISVDGGQYISTFSSYAPEELVPGHMRDNLNFSVYSNTASGYGTANIAFRILDNMVGNLSYYRIAAANTATLSSNLSLTDTSIQVSNASVLPLPNPSQNTPGVIFINGEKIAYWRNYALETPTSWAANLITSLSTLVSYSSNLYITTGNIYDTGGTFGNVAANVTQVQANTLAQIRRGVDGTAIFTPNVTVWTPNLVCNIGTPIWHSGNLIGLTTGNVYSANFSSITGNISPIRVVDTSPQQLVPNSTPTSSNIGLTSKTYNSTGNVSYLLSLNSAITANIGQYINQIFTSNSAIAANLYVLGNVTISNVVAVNFVSGNITTLPNTANVVGTSSNTSVATIGVLGKVNAQGNVTLLPNTVVYTSNIWTSSNSSLDSSTTQQAQFLLARIGFVPTGGTTP